MFFFLLHSKSGYRQKNGPANMFWLFEAHGYAPHKHMLQLKCEESVTRAQSAKDQLKFWIYGTSVKDAT